MILGTGCLTKILEFALIKKLEIQLPCLRIIGNLASSSNKICEKLAEENTINVLVNLLSSPLDKEVQHNILWCLINFSDSSIKIVNSMIDNDKFNIILFNLLISNPDTKVNLN
jgi:hypothetical protein